MADRPELLVFDVNETLSDLAPMARRFEEVGVPGHLAQVWFAGLLRDGFALTVHEQNPAFADIGRANLRNLLPEADLDRPLDDAVAYVMEGFMQLPVHPDVVEGIEALADLGIRLVTLTNGATAVGEGLLERAGVLDKFERLMSVEDAGVWKPHADAYAYALKTCEVDAGDAMLVAVHPWDTDGATRAGLRATYVNRAGTSYPTHFRSPELEVDSITALARELS
jgi:2-haloacid dehalogenase